MEPTTFDELTKALATATSRRQALKTLAATTLGGLLGLGGMGTAFARPCKPNGYGCNSSSQCCSELCHLGTCVSPCSPDGFPCLSSSDCCPGLVCNLLDNHQAHGMCVSCIADNDFGCVQDSDCCNGLPCNQSTGQCGG